jgi:hypothetical protein
MMRSSLPGLAASAAIAALALVSGCSNAKAQVAMPESTSLSIPQAPARVVVPPTPEPPPVASETPPATSTSGSANPPANNTRPNRDPRPVPTPPANPPAPATPPASPATPLETQANQSELEQRTLGLLGSAKATLDKINPQSLSADGRSQHDAAKRFVAQAEAALKVKNVVYAWQLADKANTIATLLLRHS